MIIRRAGSRGAGFAFWFKEKNNDIWLGPAYYASIIWVMKGIKVYHYALSYDDCSIRVYWSFTTISYKCLIAININFTLSYNAGIMLNAFNDPL